MEPAQNMELTEEQIQRYARHIVLPEVGGEGQKKLINSRVLVVGAGGLGAPILMYLAAAGVGTLGVIDDDLVELSNLQRQIIHTTERIGIPKIQSAAAAIADINPNTNIITHQYRLTRENAISLTNNYDLIADGSDNFETRFLINDACHFQKKTLVSGAILRFEGQIATFKSGVESDSPCYRCLYSDPPQTGLVPSCSDAGVLGALAGIVGSIQALEIIKELIGIGASLSGSLIIYDALTSEQMKLQLKQNSNCKLCGDRPSITSVLTPSS